MSRPAGTPVPGPRAGAFDRCYRGLGDQLIIARNWQSASGDDTLACGAAIPDRLRSE
jgi:hypothetical protein